MNSLTEYFGTSSPLVSLLPGFQPRNGQAWMAQAVSDAINSNENLVIEAGTGTGKTLACGSGACAALVAAFKNKLTDSNAEIILEGGSLNINWNTNWTQFFRNFKPTGIWICRTNIKFNCINFNVI